MFELTLRFVPANSDFNGYCFDIYQKDFNFKQDFVGQLIFKKDFSDAVVIGLIAYSAEGIINYYRPKAIKVISELKEKGILSY